MVENRNDLLQQYRQARAELFAAIDGLSDELMTERSLDGWSITDHLAHLAFWDELRAGEVVRISAGYDAVWRMTDEQDAAIDGLAYDLRRSMSPDQARWEIQGTGQQLLDAIASANDRGLDASRYGEAGLVNRHVAEHTGWIKRWRADKGM